MKITNKNTSTETVDPAYKSLYKIGGLAALVAALIFRRNLDAEYLLLGGLGIIHTGPTAPPSAVTGWFTLLQQDKLLGLTLLNLFDMVNYALVGLIFLALCTALRRSSPSWITLAAALGFAGVTIYLASNQALAMLALSKGYFAATSEAQRGLILAAGQALLAIYQDACFTGSGIYLSFLLVSVSGLIIATAMLKSSTFSRLTGYMGILANGFGLAYYLVLAFAKELTFLPLSISAIFLLAWYLLVGGRLWSLSSNRIPGYLKTGAPSSQEQPNQENYFQTV
jgi:hypothetical protein